MLLWYTPNTESHQSKKNDILYLKEYDGSMLKLILSELGLSDSDFLVQERIEKECVDFFSEKVCVECQKIIITLGNDDKTKINSLFRHIRNIIAHGRFIVLEDTLYGIDIKTNKNGEIERYTAIVKVKIDRLLDVLRLYNSIGTNEELVIHAFEKAGYKVQREMLSVVSNRSKFDYVIEKGGQRFVLEVKKHPRYLNKDALTQIENLAGMVNSEGNSFVLVVYSSILTKEAIKIMKNKSFFIIDKKDLQALIMGADVLSKKYIESRGEHKKTV